MTRKNTPAIDGHHRKGRLIGGSGCKLGGPSCFTCKLEKGCEWTGGVYEESLNDIEELLDEIAEENENAI